MYAQTRKTKENVSRAVANSVSQKSRDGNQGIGFLDNRPEAIQMRQLQELVENKPPFERASDATIIQRNKDPRDTTPHTAPEIFNAIRDAHAGMLNQLLGDYGPDALYVGIGGSPEILIKALRSVLTGPTRPVIVPISDLPSVADLRQSAEELDEDDTNVYVDRVASYFARFLDRADPAGKRVVVLDYVSTGTSLRSAADIIQSLYPSAKVVAQPIAAKGGGGNFDQPPLVDDEEVVGLLNRDEVKMLTRGAPKVAVNMETLSTEEGLFDAYRTGSVTSPAESLDLRVRQEPRNGAYSKIPLNPREARSANRVQVVRSVVEKASRLRGAN